MQLKSFYRALRNVSDRFDWKRTRNGLRGYLKTDCGHDRPVCPITAVYVARTGKYVKPQDASEVVSYLNIEDHCIIMTAADLHNDDFNQCSRAYRLRQVLEKNVGLKAARAKTKTTKDSQSIS